MVGGIRYFEIVKLAARKRAIWPIYRGVKYWSIFGSANSIFSNTALPCGLLIFRLVACMDETTKRLNVLLVERDAAFRQLVNIFIKMSGMAPTSVPSASTALKLVVANPDKFVLLITNAIMPDTDGWSLYQQLLKYNPNLKAIFTSSESHGELVRAHELPIPESCFVRKPFGQSVLEENIVRVLAED